MACQEFRKEVDAVFPEHISRLNRGAADGTLVRRNQRRFLYREAQPSAGAIGRYRTQPVTFDEIKEVDEEVLNEEILPDDSAATVAQSEEDLMQQKFQKLRLRRRGSHRTARRPLLRPSNSHDESEFDCSSYASLPQSTGTDQTHQPFLSST
ncbi:Uncharacterized protein APZ42_015060 [Daphnia magna]|uniref:Uncharacterized protein n=1 Tax=Daphnia magna TaxID=35525 RepID=A0A162P513_9CRUS|nr:Uncharacterized protein APZ42_015060 [Daphnia magna]